MTKFFSNIFEEDNTNNKNESYSDKNTKSNNYEPFDISKFSKELYENSKKSNCEYFSSVTNISGYDISTECIAYVCYKLMKTPVENLANRWLPLSLRATIGSSIHDFIQSNTSQFTETEISIRVPSIRVSARIDALISNNILVEIKSCTYGDYDKIIKTNQPRKSDFYQAMLYKYILENHLSECKIQKDTRTQPPILDNYKIDTIQFIYVAHDVYTSECDCINDYIKFAEELRKKFNPKQNQLCFMSSLEIDVSDNEKIAPYINYVEEKIKRINHYLDNNKLPNKEDEFIKRDKCYFCVYNNICQVK